MRPLLLVMLSYGRSVWRNVHDPEFQVLGVIFAVLLAVGTLFYSLAEGWGPLDALYFCVITLATVGYGDLTPKTAVGKAFTVLYILMGIGVIVTFAARIAGGAEQEARRRRDARRRQDGGPDPGEGTR